MKRFAWLALATFLIVGSGASTKLRADIKSPTTSTTEPAATQVIAQAATTQPAQRIQPPSHRPVAAIHRAVVISIDGLRPDMLLRANAPRLHALFHQGCYTFWAKTTALAITLPSHVTMMTGLLPRRHEIEWNKDLPLSKPIYPNGDTLFELAHHYGYTTAMAAGKMKFSVLDKPGTLDWKFIPSVEKIESDEVTQHAIEMIEDHRPDVFFIHLPTVDNVGHAHGWGTAKQLAAVENADACVGQIVDALRRAGVLDETLIIITSDHGGAGKTHGPDDPRSRHIPWIVVGPGIRNDVDLTTDDKLEVNIQDTFATVCYVLGIRYKPDIDGKPIKEVVQYDELLVPAQ